MKEHLPILNINIFIGLDAVAQPAGPNSNAAPVPTPTRLDPVAELKAASGPITIDIRTRYQNSNIPFVDMARGDRRWLGYLLRDLQNIALGSSADYVIMNSKATVRTRDLQYQTWQNFIDDLVADKVKKGHDFTQGQLKHIPKLIALLSKGTKLVGCGSLEFKEELTGKILK